MFHGGEAVFITGIYNLFIMEIYNRYIFRLAANGITRLEISEGIMAFYFMYDCLETSHFLIKFIKVKMIPIFGQLFFYFIQDGKYLPAISI